jgi:hypothetical protein
MQIRAHAWVTSSCFEDPEGTIAKLKAAGIAVAVFMLNDYFGETHRAAEEFRTFNVDKIKAMAAACHAAGIPVHATTWVMPHQCFVDGLRATLPDLLEAIGCTLLILDAEEPWTQAEGSFDYESAAQQISLVFPRLGLSGIGSAESELIPLAKYCVIWGPQAYATIDSQATPGGVAPYSYNCWMTRFGPPREGWVMGLAAYDQASNPADTMQPVIDDLISLGVTDGCYWTINYIAKRADVTKFVYGLGGETEPAPVEPPPIEQPASVGIMPTLPILSMPRVKDHNVLIVQALLQDVYGIGVGELDGIPGPKTEAGVAAFQASRRLPETGVVDPNTWHALLSKPLPQ